MTRFVQCASLDEGRQQSDREPVALIAAFIEAEQGAYALLHPPSPPAN